MGPGATGNVAAAGVGRGRRAVYWRYGCVFLGCSGRRRRCLQRGRRTIRAAHP